MSQEKIIPWQIRKIILEQSKRANVGHIGSALSIVEILAALYNNVLKISDPEDPDRDRFILSKGHAALALYGVLQKMGWISLNDLNSFCTDGTMLGVHPEAVVKGIDFSTGSLGQGLSFGVGAALAAKIRKSNRKVYVLVSDAECNEGIVWESVMFAAHHKLSNLIVIVDDNKQQAFGYTKDVLSLHPIIEKWKTFGWSSIGVDGHDMAALTTAMKNIDAKTNRPHVVVAETTFGKGVSFMEKKIAWHYLPLSDDQFSKAVTEVEKTK